ncbi:MAG: TolC family protein [Bacteroidales bacterium]|nr:TolC family protein [Bacteroidales bacterium]
MIRIFFVCLVITSTFPLYLFAQQDIPELSLVQLLDSALEKNYLLQANEQNTLISQAEIEILKTDYQPVISTSASFSYWKFLLPNKQRLLGNSLTDMYTDVSVRQTIYDWGANRVKREQVEDEIMLNEEVRRQLRNTIIWGVADAYFGFLAVESEIEVYLNSLKQLESHLQYAESLYKIGKASSIDMLKTEVQISVERKKLHKAQNDLVRQKIRIKRLCYLGDDELFEIENISETLYSRLKNKLISPSELYDRVMQNHPLLNASEQEVLMEMKQKEVYRLQSNPEIYSFGTGSWEHGYIPFGKNFNYNVGAGVRYTIPLWGGSSYKSKMMQSDYRVEQLNNEREQAYTDIRKEIDIAINTIGDIKTEIINNERIIDLAAETLSNAEVRYQGGQGNIIDVLDAQSILTETTIARYKSTIEYLQTMVLLHYLAGNDDYPF